MQGRPDLVGREDGTTDPASASHLLSGVRRGLSNALRCCAGSLRGSWQAGRVVSAHGTFSKPIPTRVNVPLVLCNLCHQVEVGRPELHSEQTRAPGQWPGLHVGPPAGLRYRALGRAGGGHSPPLSPSRWTCRQV